MYITFFATPVLWFGFAQVTVARVLIKFSTPIKIQSKGRCVQINTNERQLTAAKGVCLSATTLS